MQSITPTPCDLETDFSTLLHSDSLGVPSNYLLPPKLCRKEKEKETQAKKWLLAFRKAFLTRICVSSLSCMTMCLFLHNPYLLYCLQSDVFSFGVILYELFHRYELFHIMRSIGMSCSTGVSCSIALRFTLDGN